MKRGNFNLRGVLPALPGIAILASTLFPTLGSAAAGEDSAKTNAAGLHLRVFKVDINTFLTSLNDINARTNLPRTGMSGSDFVTGITIGYFKTIGVNFEPPKTLFFDYQHGTMTVQATAADLELIEQALNPLNPPPAEVTVKVRLVEFDTEDTFKPEFDWLFQMIAKNGDKLSSIKEILAEPKFRGLLQKIKDGKDTILTDKGEATTLSGRQSTFELGEFKGSAQRISSSSTIERVDNQNPLILDVVPYVVATNGYTIELAVIATATVATNYVAIETGNSNASPPPPPHTRVHQLVMTCTVFDGQTAMILLNQPYGLHGKRLVAFVTATIIDSSGDRKFSPEHPPFPQDAVPPQTPAMSRHPSLN